MTQSQRRHALAALVGAGLVAIGPSALALECKDLPSPVYGIGGSAQKPLFKQYGKALSGATPPETIVYQAPGACLGPSTIISGTKLTGTASYWDAAGTEQTCDLPLAGQTADFGASGVFATNCAGIPSVPADVGDFLGPVQPFVFIVPKASSQSVISAAAGYFVYGFGAAGQAAPWTDETQIITRDANSAAAIAIARAINVPVDKLKGVDAKSNGNTVTLVSTSPTREAAIGFVSGEVADAEVTDYGVLGVRFDHYDPDADFLEKQKGKLLPASQAVDTVSPVVGPRRAPGRASPPRRRTTPRRGRARDDPPRRRAVRRAGEANTRAA